MAKDKIYVAQDSNMVYSRGVNGYFIIPEPATMVLLVSGAGLVLTRRRRR